MARSWRSGAGEGRGRDNHRASIKRVLVGINELVFLSCLSCFSQATLAYNCNCISFSVVAGLHGTSWYVDFVNGPEMVEGKRTEGVE